jgi:hypothetical protein
MPTHTADEIAQAMREELDAILGDEVVREIVAAQETSLIGRLLAGLAF